MVMKFPDRFTAGTFLPQSPFQIHFPMYCETQNALNHRGWQSGKPTFDSDKVGYAVQGPLICFHENALFVIYKHY